MPRMERRWRLLNGSLLTKRMRQHRSWQAIKFLYRRATKLGGLFRLQNESLEPVYKNTDMRNHFNNSILLDGSLYGFDGDSHIGRLVTLNCIDFGTGKPAWKQRGLGCGSLLIADGKLLILAEDGTLVLAKASPVAYTELARSPFLEGRCWTVPVLADGRVYGRNAAGKLVCVTLPKATGSR